MKWSITPRTDRSGREAPPRWLALSAFCLLAACGGGGGGGSQPEVPAPVPTTGSVSIPAGSTIVDVGVGDENRVIHVMPGERTAHRLQIVGARAGTTYEVTITQGSAFVTAAESDGRWTLTVNSSSLNGNTAVAWSASIVERASGTTAQVGGPIKVLTPAVIGQGQVADTGGAVFSNDGDLLVEFGPQLGAAPVGVTLFSADTPDGKLLRIGFDRDVSNDTRTVRIESAAEAGVTGALARGSTRRALSAPKRQVQSEPQPGFQAWDMRSGVFTLFGGYRLDDQARLVAALSSLSCRGVALASSGDRICLLLAPAWRLSSMRESKVFDPQAPIVRPVLFVHGYTWAPLGPVLGGGLSTWGEFPAQLVNATAGTVDSPRALPFEFQWATNAKFEQVADELARAVFAIHAATGQPVTIVAHSFGGVLVRTMVQGLGSKKLADSLDLQGKIARVVTLGAPHSGIAKESLGFGDVTLPIGRDPALDAVLGMSSCNQISCHEMGEPTLSDIEAGMFGVAAAPGDLTARLANLQANTLPASVPFAVGIGLAVDRGIVSAEVRPGDGLISFAGQRFFPPNLDGGASQGTTLLNCDRPEARQVKEVVLGHPIGTQPGQPTSIGQKGMVHTSVQRSTALLDAVFAQENAALLDGVLNRPEAEVHSADHPSLVFLLDALNGSVCPAGPTITSEPLDVSVEVGRSAVFEVVAFGDPPTTYQWLRGTDVIQGGSAASLRIDAVTSADDGAQFTVMVTSGISTISSRIAVLRVVAATPPPVIDRVSAKGRLAVCLSCSLAVRADGSMVVAGLDPNINGQHPLGGANLTAGLWSEMPTLPNVHEVVSSHQQSLAVLTDGSLWVTGDSALGRLGSGDTAVNAKVLQWTRIEGMAGVESAATGGAGASYAVTSGGQLWVTGSNSSGQIGLPPPAGQTVHLRWAQVPGMNDVQRVAATGQHALTLRTGGAVWVTGQNTFGGESIIGLGRGVSRVFAWQPVPGLADVVDIATGFSHSLALKSNGRIWATGDNLNSSAQLSSFGWTPQEFFAEVPGITDVKTVVAAKSCSMAITGDGSLWVTGLSFNSSLGLGLGAPSYVATWQRVPNLSSVVAVNTDCDHSIAIKSDGTLWVAGANTSAGLGLGNAFNAPRIVSVWTQVQGLSGF